MQNNKTILVTGSSRGIGAAIARLANKQGYTVILHGRTESDELRKISRELNSKYVVFNVSNEYQVKNEIEKTGNIDILINNAGINSHSAPYEELSSEMWNEIFNTNVIKFVVDGKLEDGTQNLNN